MRRHPIHILHIALSLKVGGLERFIQNLIRNMTEGYVCSVVCLEEKGEIGEEMENIQVTALGKPKGFHPVLIMKIRNIIKQNGIDIVHTHNPSPHFYGALAGFLCNVPVVHTKHGQNHPENQKKIRLNKFASYFTKVVIPVSYNIEKICIKVENIQRSKIFTIQNGIETKLFYKKHGKRTKLEELGVPKEAAVIGIVARLSPEKDHKTLLKACSLLKLKEATKEFRLIIVGDGILRAQLETEANELGIKNQIIFTGQRMDVPDLLSEMDVFVLSSIKEGLSITLLEAMASSIPIIATNVGGNPEVVVHEETGILVPPMDPEAIANALFELLHDMKKATKLGTVGRERVMEKFSITSTAKKYETIYNTCLRIDANS